MGGSPCESEQSFEGNGNRATWVFLFFFFFFFEKRAFRLERTASAKALRQECFCVSSQASWGRDQRGVNRREAAVSRGGWERPRGVKDGGAEN